MKKMNVCKLLSRAMVGFVALSTSLVGVSANDAYGSSEIVDLNDGIVIYDEVSIRTSELNQALLEAKADLFNYYHTHGAEVCIPNNRSYMALVENVESIKEQLNELGSIPTKEFLYDLNFFGPIADDTQAGEIEDFYYQFEDVFDLVQTTNTYVVNGITYNVCDISIHDGTDNGFYFGSSLEPIDLLEERETYSDILRETLNEAMFVRSVKLIAGSTPITTLIYDGVVEAQEFVVDLIELRDRLDAVDGVTFEGLTPDYTLRCFGLSNPHFVFVRVGSGAWQHSYTYNEVQIYEKHDWTLILNIDHDLQDFSGVKTYEYELGYNQDSNGSTPTGICQKAVTAYRSNYLYTNPMTEYTMNLSSFSQIEGIINLEIYCPLDQFELFQYAMG